MKISEIISESIINLPEAVFAGSVINCIVDKKLKKLSHYILLNQEDEEVFLPIKKLQKGIDSYLITEGDAISNDRPFGVRCPINMSVFDTDGKRLGRLKDFDFDENGKITDIYSEKGKEDWEIIIISPQMTVVKGNKSLKVKKEKNIKTKLKEIYVDEKAGETVCKEEKITTPKRVVSDYSFLLGRQVIKDIFLKNMEILAKAGNTITTEIVKQAGMHGKLVELTVNSKRT